VECCETSRKSIKVEEKAKKRCGLKGESIIVDESWENIEEGRGNIERIEAEREIHGEHSKSIEKHSIHDVLVTENNETMKNIRYMMF
jgi:hypothetical protein